jgi:hypothetical protein
MTPYNKVETSSLLSRRNAVKALAALYGVTVLQGRTRAATRANSPLAVQFCGSVANIWCAEPELRQLLARYFRHCLLPGGSRSRRADAAITYRVLAEGAYNFQLECDGRLVHVGPTPLYMLMYLGRDLPARLASRCQERLAFHAAGLARGEQGILLCGEPDSGKSTLAAWLTVQGFDFLSDDLIAITPGTRAMSGLPCPIRLKAGSSFVWQRWLGCRAERSRPLFFKDTAWIDPELLRPGCLAATASPQLLIFPRYTADSPLVAQPLSTAEAAYRLMPRLVNYENLASRGFAEVAWLALKTRAYSLSYADVEHAAAWISQAAEALAPEPADQEP